jgi:hypothetical protein
MRCGKPGCDRKVYTVIRFWNHEVLKQIETVKNAIWSTLNAPLLNPPAKRGRGESEFILIFKVLEALMTNKRSNVLDNTHLTHH